MAKYIAAVSGGPDSMALLHMYRKQIVAVCHINYQKRISADRDMSIVEKYCETIGMPLEKLVVTKSLYDKYQNYKNFQNIARIIRYDFFIKCATKYSVNTVLVAHNKDDFLETALIQRKRKSKSLFYGIVKKGKYKTLNVYRPLLNMWKGDLLQYCKKNNIPYGLDETNELDIYERNRIRKALDKLSTIEKTNEIERIKKYNKEQKDKLTEIKKKYDLWKLHGFNVDFYRSLPKWMHEQIIYQFLVLNNIHKISSNKVQLVDQFLQANRNQTRLRLGKNYQLQKIDKILILKKEIYKNI